METVSVNAPALLRELIRKGGVTRLDLQATLGVSGPTVTRTILELSERGIVDSSLKPAGGKGRPAETLDLAGDGLCVIAVSIRAERVVVALVDAHGQRVKHQRLPVGEHTDYTEAVAAIGKAVLEMADEAAGRFRCLAGIGISFGGSADYAAGTITVPSAFQQWRGKPLARDLEFYTGLPAAIDNYSFALVGALNWFDADKRSDFFLVVADYGIGGVSSIEDRAYLGGARRPGAFGHTGARRDGGQSCHCGGYDCLTATCSMKALARQAREMQLPGCEAEDHAELLRGLEESGDAAAHTLLAQAAGRIAGSALDLCRGMGFATAIFGGVLFDVSPTARQAVEEVFGAPGHDCTPRFLMQVFEGRSPDDLAGAAVAYQRLSDTREVHMFDGGRSHDTLNLRRSI